MMTFGKYLILSFLMVFLVACGNFSRTKVVPPEVSGQKETRVDFATVKSEILQPLCISCHTGRHAAYENYQVVRGSLTAILDRVTTSNPSLRMPKDGAPLTEAQISLLRDWIAGGAPEFVGEESKEDNDDQPMVVAYSFQDIKSKILTPKCVACHSHFNDYAPVKRLSGAILSAVLSDRMPFPQRKNVQVIPLDKADKDMLLAWVGQGAPEFPGGPTGDLRPAELKPNWISLRNNVFGPKCIHCHNSFGPRAPTTMETHTKLRDWFAKNPDLFNFSRPEDSHFVGAILGRVDEDEFFFDPMPFNSPVDDVPTDLPPVTEQELNVIKKWIELKLPFNEEDR